MQIKILNIRRRPCNTTGLPRITAGLCSAAEAKEHRAEAKVDADPKGLVGEMIEKKEKLHGH
eukprot:1159938-Pelagomonas_calceolata.AAC.3